MPNKDEADKAIAALNGKDLKGRTWYETKFIPPLAQIFLAVHLISPRDCG